MCVAKQKLRRAGGRTHIYTHNTHTHIHTHTHTCARVLSLSLTLLTQHNLVSLVLLAV